MMLRVAMSPSLQWKGKLMKKWKALWIKITGAAFAVLAILLFMPVTVAADGFSVSPPSIYMTDAAIGQTVERTLSINNKEDTPQTYTVSVETTPANQRREGYGELPDNSWVSFDQETIEVAANSSGVVTVRVQIPDDEQWKSQRWETWIKVTAPPDGLFNIVIYVRLLISTGEPAAINWGLIGGIGGAVIAVAAVGVWYFVGRRRQVAH